MTAHESDLILQAIQNVRDDIAEIKSEAAEIKAEVKRTNGRVSKLELWRAGLDAVTASKAWLRPAAIAFLSGAFLTFIGAVLGHYF